MSQMPELAACLMSTSADVSASLLQQGITRVLDTMAPVRTIQNRKSYVPYLTGETKQLQADVKAAQVTAVESGQLEDWRLYRSVRNQKNRAVKEDQLRWQKDKLSITTDPSDMWKVAKTMLGWAYLEKHSLLHPNHHGGRKWHNTTTALIQLNNEWLAAAEEGMLTGVMMTDLSAAYDLWDHKLGLDKAQLMGLTQGACSWLSSYLRGRSQSTVVDGYISSSLRLPSYSVPQGSVGAPLLFLMANSDLPDVIHDHPVNYSTPTGH